MKAVKVAVVVGAVMAGMMPASWAGVGPHLWRVKVTGTTFEGTGSEIIPHKFGNINLTGACKLGAGAQLVLDTSSFDTNQLIFVNECGLPQCVAATLLNGDATCAEAVTLNGGEEVCTIDFVSTALGGAQGTVISNLKLSGITLKGTAQGAMVAGGRPGFISIKVLGPFKPASTCP